MKKIIALIIAAVLITALSAVPAFAGDDDILIAPQSTSDADGISTMTYGVDDRPDALISDWEENGYPDDVGGIFVYTKGYDPSAPSGDFGAEYYCIYVLEGTSDARKAELKALAGSEYIEFVECKYSYNQLKAVADEIFDMMQTNSAVVFSGIQIKENAVGVGIIEEYYDVISADLTKIYGDMIHTETGIYTTVPSIGDPKLDGGMTAGIDEAKSYFFVAAALALILCGGAAFFVLRAKKAHTLALSNGETASDDSSLTVKETEKKVAESAKAPSEHVYDDIMKKL